MVFKTGWNKSKEKKPEAPKVEATKVEVAETIKPESPTYTAFYVKKDKGAWNLVTCKVQDDKIVSQKVKVCENKAHSLEAFKIAFAHEYYFGQ